MAKGSKHSALLDFISTRAWAMDRRTFANFLEIVARHVHGVKVDPEDVKAIVQAREERTSGRPVAYEIRNGNAVIPIRGVIAKHASQVNGASQPEGQSIESLRAMLQDAAADEKVKRILLAIDSPGGSVDGLPSFADELHAVRGKKPIVAHADGLMASAAFWLGSQADKVYATRESEIGSIGVYATASDWSRHYKNEGVDVHLISSGGVKGQGARGTPVPDAVLEDIQTAVDNYNAMFLDAVMRGRGWNKEQASALNDGRLHLAGKARELGLIDGVRSLESLLSEDVSGTTTNAKVGTTTYRVAADPIEITAGQKGSEPSPAGAHTEKTMDEKNAAPAPQEQTAESVTKAHPRAAADLLAQGAQQERQRSKEIREAALPGQEKLADKLIAEGTSPDEARKALLADARAYLADRKEKADAAANQPLGQPAPTVHDEGESLEAEGKFDEAKCRAEFSKDKKAQKVFGSVDQFIAYKRGLAVGAFSEE